MTATASAINLDSAYAPGSDHRSRKARASHFLRRMIESVDCGYAIPELAAIGPYCSGTTGQGSADHLTTGGPTGSQGRDQKDPGDGATDPIVISRGGRRVFSTD